MEKFCKKFPCAQGWHYANSLTIIDGEIVLKEEKGGKEEEEEEEERGERRRESNGKGEIWFNHVHWICSLL